MKLNNKGWSIKQMIYLSMLLFVTLLFACYYIYAFYNDLDTSDGITYANMELKLEMAAIKYCKDNKGCSYISFNELKAKGYIDKLVDDKGRTCDGYVTYQNNEYQTFIKCQEYITKGY